MRFLRSPPRPGEEQQHEEAASQDPDGDPAGEHLEVRAPEAGAAGRVPGVPDRGGHGVLLRGERHRSSLAFISQYYLYLIFMHLVIITILN